jgi:hypothetical protein
MPAESARTPSGRPCRRNHAGHNIAGSRWLAASVGPRPVRGYGHQHRLGLFSRLRERGGALRLAHLNDLDLQAPLRALPETPPGLAGAMSGPRSPRQWKAAELLAAARSHLPLKPSPYPIYTPVRLRRGAPSWPQAWTERGSPSRATMGLARRVLSGDGPGVVR